MQVSVLKEVLLSGTDISKRRLLHSVACLSGAKERPESCEHLPDLPSACEESLSALLVTGESCEGQASDLQR